MKIKMIGIVLSFLLVVLSVLLFIKEAPLVKVIVSPKCYSLMKSSETELFNVTIIVSNPESYYFNPEYIANISLSSDTDEIISLVLNEISKSNEFYIYNNELYYYLTFELSIGFNSDDYLISMDKAYLNINYNNAKEMKLYIGEFNYLFNTEVNKDISLNNLLATHALINEIDTASGLFLNLGNLSDNNITISKVELGTSFIKANNFHLKEVYDIPDITTSPEDILNIENYNYALYGEYELNTILLRENNEVMFYVPISYTGDIPYLYRFYVKVYYVIDSVEKVYVIDDFPYINTSSYKGELESEFVYYEYEY